MRVAFGDLLGNGTERERSKRLACGNPGAIWTRCEAGLLRGTYGRCRGVSTDQTTISVVTDEVFTFGLKSWSRGQKSQGASAVCSGGVSAVMGSSDLDAHTLGSRGALGNQLSCSLPFWGDSTDCGNGLPSPALRRLPSHRDHRALAELNSRISNPLDALIDALMTCH